MYIVQCIYFQDERKRKYLIIVRIFKVQVQNGNSLPARFTDTTISSAEIPATMMINQNLQHCKILRPGQKEQKGNSCICIFFTSVSVKLDF